MEAGSYTSIFSTPLLVGFITVFGSIVGILCAWMGKWVDTLLMRLPDMFLAFPRLVFALAVAAVLGGGVHNAIFVLGPSVGQSMRAWHEARQWHSSLPRICRLQRWLAAARFS